MELYDESELNENKSNKKMTNIILVLIILSFLIIIGIIVALMLTQRDELTIAIDGNYENSLKNELKFESNDNIYFPIKKIASYLGYNCYNGDYSQPSEDTSKCYIQSENEVVNFSLNSDTIYKIKPNSTTNYESFQINEPIKAIDGELYVSIDGLKKAFNVDFSYSNNKIEMYTLNYLVGYYSNVVINYGYNSIHEDFENKKTILDGMLVVKKDEKYGVIDTNGNSILDTKYDDIDYLRHTGDFLVNSNGKVGIISKNKQTKVSVAYDDIELMDSTSNLYKIKQNNKFGVIDINGNIKIYPEYDAIGVNIGSYQYNNIKNGYVLLDTLIPVQKDKLWGMFDKSGNKVVDFKYDDLGYVQNNSKNMNNLLIIPDYNAIVVKKNDKYNLISLKGNEIFNVFLDSVYTTTENGEEKYYMVYNDTTNDLLPYLKSYASKSSSKGTDINEETTNVTNNTTINENSTNNINNLNNTTLNTKQNKISQ